MKSLLDSPIQNENPNMFTPEIMKFIIKDGFTYGSNDSYFYSETDLPWCSPCYKKKINCNYDISIYIFSNVIGVDIDYDCGGNYSNKFWLLSDYTFEDAYDNMVDYVNVYRS